VSDIRGDVWISSGFFAENTLAGATTGYEDFRVWFLDSSEPSSEPVEVVVWGDGEVLFDLPGEGRPVVAETMSSATTLDVDFDVLTDGGHAIAIRAGADEGAVVLACNEIPSAAAPATG